VIEDIFNPPRGKKEKSLLVILYIIRITIIRYKNIIIIIIIIKPALRHSVHLLISLHTPFAVSLHTLQSPIHTSSSLFLSVAVPLLCFLQMCESQNVHTH